MKKILIILCLTFPTLSYASIPPKVTLEGRMDFQMGSVKQKDIYKSTTPGNLSKGSVPLSQGFVNDTILDIKIDGSIDNNLTYGGFLRFHGDTSLATNQESFFGDKAMIYVQHNKIGRLEMGNTPGAGGLFEMDTVNLGRGAYGVEGFWSQWVQDKTIRTSRIFNKSQLVFGGFTLNEVLVMSNAGSEKATRNFEFLVAPNLFSNYSGHYYSDAPKINLFTKPIPELTLGITFIPDLDSAGTIRGQAPINSGPLDERKGTPASFKNIISGGFMYETKLTKDFGFKTGIAGEYGKAKLPYVKNLRSYEAGLMFSYKDVKLGGTFGSWMDSLSLKQKINGARHGSNYYTLGFSHQIEKFGYTISAMESNKAGGIEILGYQIINSPLAPVLPFTDINLKSFSDPKKNKFRNIALDVDYKLVNGFVPYAGIAMFRFKESHGFKDEGYVAILGTRITF